MRSNTALSTLLLSCLLSLTAARLVPFALQGLKLDSHSPPRGLPVFFFHGITGYPEEAVHLQKALEAQGRELVALSFCPHECSIQSLHAQVPMAIRQVREIVARDRRFQAGYVFIGHSQGGIMARSVIEEMDDHQVHTFISLAGAQNGVFYGPQAEDLVPLRVLLSGFGQQLVPREVFDFDKYQDRFGDDPNVLRGEIQRDTAQLIVDRPDLQDEYSFVNLARFPDFSEWVKANAFLPVMNNVNECNDDDKCVDNKLRRKQNFLKLQAAHFFASPNDGVIAPWQICQFGRYSEVDSLDEITTEFEDLRIVGMNETLEFVEDTFGLRTLSERGGLFLYEVPGVSHGCWIADGRRLDDPTKFCEFQPLFDEFIAPILP